MFQPYLREREIVYFLLSFQILLLIFFLLCIKYCNRKFASLFNHIGQTFWTLNRKKTVLDLMLLSNISCIIEHVSRNGILFVNNINSIWKFWSTPSLCCSISSKFVINRNTYDNDDTRYNDIFHYMRFTFMREECLIFSLIIYGFVVFYCFSEEWLNFDEVFVCLGSYSINISKKRSSSSFDVNWYIWTNSSLNSDCSRNKEGFIFYVSCRKWIDVSVLRCCCTAPTYLPNNPFFSFVFSIVHMWEWLSVSLSLVLWSREKSLLLLCSLFGLSFFVAFRYS